MVILSAAKDPCFSPTQAGAPALQLQFIWSHGALAVELSRGTHGFFATLRMTGIAGRN
jgi:hypothetical protein